MSVKSPITNSINTKLIKSIDSRLIIDGYFKTYGMDISRFFNGLAKIDQYICLDTGYKFFHPFSTSGDSQFYEDLQKFDWYYMDWKWENDIASKFIKQTDNVLEIGSGKGIFLKYLSSKSISAHGLELNNESVKKGKQDGLSISNETIQDHALNNAESYDVVYSFQVMEHIWDIEPVIMASVNCLKKNGQLIICVPNNESFLLRNQDSLLNLPPHHMGLWSLQSLKSLEQYYNLKVSEVYYEPLQPYHYDWYYENIMLRINHFSNRLMRYTDKLFKSLIKGAIKSSASRIHGHSIFVVYKKL